MAKYNLTETKEKKATYRSLVSPRLMDELKDKILDIILFQQKYKEKGYSAKKLAEDLNTNTRYISAVVNVRFHANYTSFVNQSFYASFYRINGITPREYKLQHFKQHPADEVKKKKKKKTKK